MAPLTLESIVSRSPTLPDRIIVHAPPGWGKTSLLACFPDPVFLCTRGEDGIMKLIASG